MKKKNNKIRLGLFKSFLETSGHQWAISKRWGHSIWRSFEWNISFRCLHSSFSPDPWKFIGIHSAETISDFDMYSFNKTKARLFCTTRSWKVMSRMSSFPRYRTNYFRMFIAFSVQRPNYLQTFSSRIIHVKTVFIPLQKKWNKYSPFLKTKWKSLWNIFVLVKLTFELVAMCDCSLFTPCGLSLYVIQRGTVQIVKQTYSFAVIVATVVACLFVCRWKLSEHDCNMLVALNY